MAQLRDAETSEILAEGTPTEVVLVAQSVGLDRVIFDGVGLKFDPQAVLAAHEEQKVIAETLDPEWSVPAFEQIEATEEKVPEKAFKATKAMEKARSTADLDATPTKKRAPDEDFPPEEFVFSDATTMHSEFSVASDGTPEQVD